MNEQSARTEILVVDDEPNTCAYISGVLSRKNWHVDTASDGPAALELMRTQHYHAVVLDYRMPGMNGAELSREIDRYQPGVPKVLLTGYPIIDTVYPAVEAGVDRVLAKPVDPAELIDVLQAQIAASGP